MKFTYKEVTLENPKWSYIERSDGAVIPLDESNSDYQAYLRWLENPDADESGTF